MTGIPDGLAAALADRYRIERELGRGGMATVYLAQDVRHDRRVAMKVMRPDLAGAIGPERFLREIRTTANLRHPHIVPLYDSGETDGRLWYVMPYVEGESLQARLARESPLGLAEALRLAREVAEALGHAHTRGIVHRDIKPGNILLEAGHAVVTDFGIASAVSVAGGEHLTQTGMIVGSPAYMSPEQASAAHTLDARSDLYSLACVLYEMLTGQPPFTAPTAVVVMARHMFDPVPPIATARPDLPAHVTRTVERTLAKAPADRYPNAEAWIAALMEGVGEDTTVRGGSAAPQMPSVVVIPFVNRSPDPDNDWFSDGLTEEIITDLSRVSALRVISRNSSMALKGTTSSGQALAASLGITHLVTGSVRRAGDHLRVTAELVDASSDRPVWSDKFSGTMEDVFGIQEEIAGKIVTALQVTLTPSERKQAGERQITSPVAYDCYLRARQATYEWTPEAGRRAHQMVDGAIAIVGETPLLLATKAQCHWNDVNTNRVSADEGLGPASDFVERALAMDPDFPLAIFVRGLVSGGRGHVEEALPDLYRAHELWPGDANIIVETCRFSNVGGLRHQGELAERLLQIDPLTPIAWLVESTWATVTGQHERVPPAVRRVVELAPAPSMLQVIGGWQMVEAGEAEEGCAVLGRVGEALQGSPIGAWALFLVHARQGNAEAATAVLTPEVQAVLDRNEFTARSVAQGYALLGRTDDALRWLRIAVTGGFFNYPHLTEYDPLFEGIRSEPGFREIAEELAKPRWERVVAWEEEWRASRR